MKLVLFYYFFLLSRVEDYRIYNNRFFYFYIELYPPKPSELPLNKHIIPFDVHMKINESKDMFFLHLVCKLICNGITEQI